MRILFIAEQIDYEPIGIMHLSSALKKAGCHSVSMGIEAGNEHIHNSLLKRLGPQEPGASGQASVPELIEAAWHFCISRREFATPHRAQLIPIGVRV